MTHSTARLATVQVGEDKFAIVGQAANPYAPEFDYAAAEAGALKWASRFIEEVENAGKLKCDLAVTTEDIAGLSIFMTYLDDRTIFRSLVEVTEPILRAQLSAAAKQYAMYVVGCYYEADGADIYNVAVLFGRDGEVIGRYRKVHLPVYETWQVTAGDHFPVFATDIGQLAMMICYDSVWAESATACALNGAQIICHPTAASMAVHRAQTRANDNQVYFLSVASRDSIITAPNGAILAEANDAQRTVAWADVDVAQPTVAPERFYEYLYSGIRDHKERHLKLRRPAAYGVLTETSPPLLEQYPAGGLATSPETIAAVYAEHKAEMERALRGEPCHYSWRATPDNG